MRDGEALSLNSLALFVGVATGPLIGQGLLRWGGFNLAWAGAVTPSRPLRMAVVALGTRTVPF